MSFAAATSLDLYDGSNSATMRIGRRAGALIAAVTIIGLLLAASYLFSQKPVSPQGPVISGAANETLNLTPPTCPTQNGSVTRVTVATVQFSLRIVEWCSFGSQVNGTGAEQPGPTYSFQLGSAAHSTTGWINWTSPDGEFGVDYNQQVTVHLWANH